MSISRRDFVKVSSLIIGAVALPPLIIEHEDNETKMFKYIMSNYDAVAVVGLVKEYGFFLAKKNNLSVTTFFRDLVKRQPHLVKWLRSQIQVGRNKPFVSLNTQSANYLYLKTHRNQRTVDFTNAILVAYHESIAPRFNMPHDKQYKLDVLEDYG